MFSVIADGDNQPYLALTALDWDEHVAGAAGSGIVVSCQVSPGQYESSTYGWTDQSAYNFSSSASDVTALPLLGTSDRNQAEFHAANAHPTQVEATGYPGSATASARPGLAAT
jgi:hypothetical protein